MKSVNKILEWINNYWGALGILGSIFSGIVVFIHYNVVMPIVDEHIDKRIMLMANDSLGLMVDSHLETKGGGFRGGLADKLGIDKNVVIDSIAWLYLDEKQKEKKIDTITYLVSYQHGFNEQLIKLTCSRVEYNHVLYYVASNGDAFYKDKYGLFWDANYKVTDDKYYFYPSYSSDRLECNGLN